MGFVIVARQFIGGRARTVSDGVGGKNFRRRKVNLCLAADWAQLSERTPFHLTPPCACATLLAAPARFSPHLRGAGNRVRSKGGTRGC